MLKREAVAAGATWMPGSCSVGAVCIGVENCWVGVFLRQAAFEPGKYYNV